MAQFLVDGTNYDYYPDTVERDNDGGGIWDKTTKSIVDKTTTIINLELKKSIHELTAVISQIDTVYMLKTVFLMDYPNKASLESVALKLLAKDEELKQLTCKIDQNNAMGLLIECPVNKQDFLFLTKSMSYVKIGDDNRFEYSLE